MKRKVVLLQSVEILLSSLEILLYKVNEQRAKEVVFTTRPKEAIRVASENENVIIISSNIFDGLGLTGRDVAVSVKEINPRALFFIYSYVPEVEKNKSFVDGFIPKGGSSEYKDLVKIITSISDETTPESLARDFPWIKLTKDLC